MIQTRIIAAVLLAASALAACETKPPASLPETESLSAKAASEQFEALQEQAEGAINTGYASYLDFLSARFASFETIAARCTPGELSRDEDNATCRWLRAAAAFELIPLSENAALQEERALRARTEATRIVQACAELSLMGKACVAAPVIAALAQARVPAARMEAWRAGRISLDADGLIDAFSAFEDTAPDWESLTGTGAEFAGRLTHSMCRAEARIQALYLGDPRFQDISRASRGALAAAARSQNAELTPQQRRICEADPQGGDCLNVLALTVRTNCPPQ